MRLRILFSPEGAAGGEGNAGAGTPSFLESLPEDIRSDPSLSTFKDPGALAKSYVSAQKMLGDRIQAPKAEWTDDQWGEFYSKVGRPEAPDKYSLPQDVQLHESLQFDDAAMKATNETFHKLGLTNKQAEGIMRHYMTTLNGRIEGEATKTAKVQEETTATLKEEWGDKFDSNLGAAKAAVAKFGGEELRAFLDESGLGNNINMVRMFANIASGMGEDTGNRSGEGAGGTLTPEGAMNKIRQIKADNTGDTDWARYWRGDVSLGRVKMDEMRQEFSKLHAIAAPIMGKEDIVSG